MQGPEIRSGKLVGGTDVQLEAGSDFTFKYIEADPKGIANPGTSTWVCQDYPRLAQVCGPLLSAFEGPKYTKPLAPCAGALPQREGGCFDSKPWIDPKS